MSLNLKLVLSLLFLLESFWSSIRYDFPVFIKNQMTLFFFFQRVCYFKQWLYQFLISTTKFFIWWVFSNSSLQFPFWQKSYSKTNDLESAISVSSSFKSDLRSKSVLPYEIFTTDVSIIDNIWGSGVLDIVLRVIFSVR